MTLAQSLLADLSIPPLPPVVAWAEENLTFPARMSPNESGQFRTARRPYMRQPLEDWRDPAVQDWVLCWGAQLGKTTVGMVGAAYRLVNDPLNLLWVMPSGNLGRSWSLSRWQPFIDANPVLAAHKPEDLDLWKIEEMHLSGMTMNIVGSNSPANLASRPAGIVVQDEVCKFAPASRDEASASQLADQRTKSFGLRGFRAKMSTPTTVENEFWLGFLQTDQRYFFLRCLHCGEMMELEHGRRTLVWDENARGDDGRWNRAQVRKTAKYHCPHCQGPHDDGMKLEMLRGVTEWRAKNPNADQGRRGYHLNSFYSPDVTFGQMAVKFLEALDLFGLQDYYNGWLALPYENTVHSIKEADVLALRRGGFRMKRLPVPSDEIHYLIITADPGDSRTHYTVCALGKGGETWVVDWGTVLTKMDLDQVYQEAEYTCADGVVVRPSFGMIDSGDRALEVYDYCVHTRGFFHPTRGMGTTFGTWGQVNPKSHPGLVLYTYVDFQAKLQLYEQRVGKKMPPLLHLPEDAGADLIDGLTGQSMIVKRRGMHVIREWKKMPDDHYGDCIKLAQLSWWVLRHEYEDAAPPPEQPEVSE